MEFDEEAELAATKIQAVFRGHKVRKGHSSSNNDVSKDDNYEDIPLKTINKKIKDDNNDNDDDDDEKLEKNIQKEENYNENYADDDSIQKELAEAAVKIQATFRGHLQRKLANKSANNINNNNLEGKQQEINVDEIRKQVAEELDIDLDDPELHKAAAKIQASFRGFKTRKDIIT